MTTYSFQEALAKCLLSSDFKMVRVDGRMEFTVSVYGKLYVKWSEEEDWELFTYFPNAHGEWEVVSKYND